MGLKFISASQFSVKLKATIHNSGKLGFTEATAKQLDFKENSAVKFAQDETDESVLYLANNVPLDDDAFRVCKAGRYFYINTKLMFDSLGIDYKNKTVMFDMVRIKELDGEIYKLIKRENKRLKKDSKETEE